MMDSVAAGMGGGHPPQAALKKAAFGGAKMWNSENWPLLANCYLHCRQWYCTPPQYPLTLSRFWGHTPTVSALRLHRKQCVHCTVHQETYTADLTGHSPAVKLAYRRSIVHAVTVLLAIAIQCLTLFTCFQILHKIWKFCTKLWLSGKSLNLLQTDVRFQG